MLQNRSRNRGFTWFYSAGGRSRERSRYRVNMLQTVPARCRPDLTWHHMTWHDMSESSVASHAVCYSWNVQCPCTECIGTKCYCGEEANRVRRDSRSRAIDRSLQNIVLTLKYIISRESNVRYELYAISIFWYVFTNICFCFKTLLLDITISSNFGQFCRTFHSCRNGIHVDNNFFI